MRDMFKSSLHDIIDPRVKRYKTSKAIVFAYYATNNTADVQLLGNSGGTLKGIPVSKALKTIIAVSNTAVIEFTDEYDPHSAVVTAVY